MSNETKLTEEGVKESLGRMLFAANAEACLEIDEDGGDFPYDSLNKTRQAVICRTAELFADMLCPSYANLVEALKLASQLDVLGRDSQRYFDKGRVAKSGELDKRVREIHEIINAALSKGWVTI